MHIETLLRSLLFIGLATPVAGAQNAPPARPGTSCRPPGFFTAPARYPSAEVLTDRRATFRLCAPEATDAMVTSSDYQPAIPLGFGGPPGLAMAKDTSGLWSVTTSAPFKPGTYRYNFRVDGARVPDPQATRFCTSASARTACSRCRVPTACSRRTTPRSRTAWCPRSSTGRRARRQAARTRLLAGGLHERRGTLPRALSRPRRG